MPKQVVWMAAAALVGVAVLGLYLGWSRNAPPGGETGLTPVSAPTGPIPNAKAISAADLARGGPLDEAAIRRIAREEAQATLGIRTTRAPADPAATDAAPKAAAPKAAPAPPKVEAPPAPAPAPPPTPAPPPPREDLF